MKTDRFSKPLSASLQSLALLFAATTMCWGQSNAEILSRLDQAAHSFTAATANIRVTTHTAIIDEDDTQVGTVVVKRYSPTEMHFLITFTGPDAQALAFRGQTLQIYYPKLNMVREYDLGKYKDLARKLILLGFGMTGRELNANYDIINFGDEHVRDQDSVRLQLTPKASEVLKQLSKVDLWISLKNHCPVQQKFYLPAGDYRLVTYSDVEIKPHLPESALDLPKAAKHERVN
jgi:outer membrane lipoprotein-sorting protein